MKRFIIEVTSSTLIVSLMLMTVFAAFEAPKTEAASAEDQFTITQTVTAEIAFRTNAADLTMSPSLGGLTGGTSTAETQVAVVTNAAAGYTMTIKASSSPAMQATINAGNSISDYTPVSAGVPDFAYIVPSGYEFGYSISASTTADLAQKFKDNGTDCNTGSSDTNASSTCWYGLSTTATSTILRTSNTPATGATTTIYFRLTVTPNSAPIEDTYRATTTFTATTN